MTTGKRDAIGLGVIGCGRIAQVAHLPALEKLPEFDLVAACDHSGSLAHSVGRRYRFERVVEKASAVFTDDDVQAVLISVPDRYHADLVTEALHHDKHVLVEKPLATSREETTRVIEAAAGSTAIVQIASMKRHDPGIAYAARAAATEIGAVISFNAWYRVPVRTHDIPYFPAMFVDQQVSQVEQAFKADQQRGQYVLATHGAHVFDTLRYILGDFTTVTAHHRQHGDDHLWAGTLQTPKDGIGWFEILANVHGTWSEGLEVHGTAGTLRLRTHVPFARRPSDIQVYTDATGGWNVPVFDNGDAYVNQLQAFAAAIHGDTPPMPSLADGVAAVALLEAASISDRTTAPVELEAATQ